MYVKTLFILLGVTSLSQCNHDHPWCMDPHHDHIDVFKEVKAFLGVTTDNLESDDVQKIITQLFLRVKCDVRGVKGGCNQVLYRDSLNYNM